MKFSEDQKKIEQVGKISFLAKANTTNKDEEEIRLLLQVLKISENRINKTISLIKWLDSNIPEDDPNKIAYLKFNTIIIQFLDDLIIKGRKSKFEEEYSKLLPSIKAYFDKKGYITPTSVNELFTYFLKSLNKMDNINKPLKRTYFKKFHLIKEHELKNTNNAETNHLLKKHTTKVESTSNKKIAQKNSHTNDLPDPYSYAKKLWDDAPNPTYNWKTIGDGMKIAMDYIVDNDLEYYKGHINGMAIEMNKEIGIGARRNWAEKYCKKAGLAQSK